MRISGTTRNGGGKQARHHWHPRQRGGERLAVKRALTAARCYLNGDIATLQKAALSCGSNVEYVQAAIVVILSENTVLLYDVLHGNIGLLVAAEWAAKASALVAALRAASAKDLAAAARVMGAEFIWDKMVLPSITTDRAAVELPTAEQPTADVSTAIGEYLETNGFGSLAEAGSNAS
jgi:hypothetical protein